MSANVNHQTSDGKTCLMVAIIGGHIETVAFLLTLPSINVNAKDNEGRTALMYAAILGYANIVKLIQKRNDLDVNLTDLHGQTALHHAIRSAAGLNCELIRTIQATAERRRGNQKRHRNEQ